LGTGALMKVKFWLLDVNYEVKDGVPKFGSGASKIQEKEFLLLTETSLPTFTLLLKKVLTRKRL
jgi:hypothetical protein